MYHPRLKGTHYEAGKHYAEILYKNGFRFPDSDEKVLSYGISCLPVLQDFYPEIVEEIKGFAEGCRTTFEQVSSFLLGIGVFNIPGQCSIFASWNGKEMIVGRNFDMLMAFKKYTEASLMALEGCNHYIGHSDVFIGKVDGINEKGLFAGMTLVPHKGKKPGLNFYFAIRYILEKCSTVEEGMEVLERFPSSVGANYLLADSSGAMAVVEKSPEACHVRKPLEGQNYIFCTNHFISEQMSFETSGMDWSWSKTGERCDTLAAKLAASEQMDLAQAVSILSDTKGHVCLNLKEHKFGTLFSIAANLNTLEILRAEGQPNRTSYKRDQRLSDLIQKKSKVQRSTQNV